MQTVSWKLTKDEYENYLELEKQGKLREEVEKDIPAEWTFGYGYYGFYLSENNGEYFINHRIGSTCD